MPDMQSHLHHRLNYNLSNQKGKKANLSRSALFLTSCSVISAEVAAKEFELESYVWWLSVNSVILVDIDPHEAGLGLPLRVDGRLRKRRGHRHLKDQHFIVRPDSKRTTSGNL